MQGEVLGRAHVGFEVAERVWHLLVRQHQPYDVHEAAGWKAKNRDVSHGFFSIAIYPRGSSVNSRENRGAFRARERGISAARTAFPPRATPLPARRRCPSEGE